jgi:hypothetical protein
MRFFYQLFNRDKIDELEQVVKEQDAIMRSLESEIEEYNALTGFYGRGGAGAAQSQLGQLGQAVGLQGLLGSRY